MYILSHTHTCTHTHAHTDTYPPQPIPLFCDTFWTLADFQELGANPVFALFMPPRTLQKPFDRSTALSGHSKTSRILVPIQFLPCLCLLGPFQNHSIGLRNFLDTHRRPGFWCHYSLTFFTACADCSNLSLTHTYIHTDS